MALTATLNYNKLYLFTNELEDIKKKNFKQERCEQRSKKRSLQQRRR